MNRTYVGIGGAIVCLLGLAFWWFGSTPANENNNVGQDTRDHSRSESNASSALQNAAPIAGTAQQLTSGHSNAEPQGLGVSDDMRRKLKEASHGNPYAETVAALNRGGLDDLAVARQVFYDCRAAFVAIKLYGDNFDSTLIHMVGSPANPSSARLMANNAKVQLEARCQSFWQDLSLRDRLGEVVKQGYFNSSAFTAWKNGTPAMKGQAPEDWQLVLSSGYGFQADKPTAQPRYIDGKLWGGASDPEIYERALRQAVINLSSDPSSSQPHVQSLVLCVQTGQCDVPIDRVMLAGIPEHMASKRDAVARLIPVIQRAIQKGNIEAFRQPS